MKTNLFRIIAAGILLSHAFILPGNRPSRTMADSHPDQHDQMTYLPLVVRASTLPQSWQLVYDMLDQFRLVVPQDWTIDEIPEPSSPLRSYHSMDNILANPIGLPVDIGGPNWPRGLYKIELTTWEQILDPQRTFEENARALLDNPVPRVTGFSSDPAYPNGTFIEISHLYAPDIRVKLFGTSYATEDGLRLLIINAFPNDGIWNESWDEPLIRFIVNSLDFQQP